MQLKQINKGTCTSSASAQEGEPITSNNAKSSLRVVISPGVLFAVHLSLHRIQMIQNSVATLPPVFLQFSFQNKLIFDDSEKIVYDVSVLHVKS